MAGKNKTVNSPALCETEKLEVKYPKAFIGTTTLTDTPYSFLEALKKLQEGACVGIRPKGNLAYMEMFADERGIREYLRWASHPNENPHGPSGHSDVGDPISVNLYTSEWYLVVLDYKAVRNGKVRLIYIGDD